MKLKRRQPYLGSPWHPTLALAAVAAAAVALAIYLS
jgi:hypothetical protein